MDPGIIVQRNAAAQSRAARAARTIQKELDIALPAEPAFTPDADVRALWEREYVADVLDVIATAVTSDEPPKEPAKAESKTKK